MRFGSTRTVFCAWLLSGVGLHSNVAVAETVGPSSRRCGLVISEIMYHPPARSDEKNLEFIELFNSEPFPADLSGYRLSGDVDYTFQTNTVISGRGFLVVAPVPADVQSAYGISTVLGGFGNPTNSLPNDGGTIRLRNKSGAILLEVTYSDESPWPAAPDGAGHSLVLTRPSLGERSPEAWAASQMIGGSPGAAEPASSDPLRSVVINEFLAHTDDPELDYIELYNHSNQDVNIAGCFLSDDPATNKFTIPDGTTIPARGFVYYTQTALGFSLSAAGETIYFKNPNQTRVLDAVRFGGQENGVSTGRSPDGAPTFRALAAKTPGMPNGPLLIRDVVINEIMYNPLSGNPDDEYVELYNHGVRDVNLGAWRFTSGIQFTFPTNQIIPAGGYLVVAKNVARLMTNYPNLTGGNTVGNFDGTLSDQGEHLSLAMPDEVAATNSHGVLVTNTIYIVVDEVTYGTGGRWGQWSDGGGSSLELVDPRSDHQLAANWADSDTPQSDWTTVESTGVLDNGNGGFPINNLQIVLHDTGECLVDNVEVIGPGGTNRIANSTFENGINSWIVQGTHEQSSLEETGFASSRSLHIRASAKGDPEANRVLVPLTVSLGASQTATIRAKVRWLRGHPEILFRVHGNHLEAPGKLLTPTNLGTPGARNGRAVTNAGPAIYEVNHSPALPAAGQSVVVTAHIHDPDGLTQILVNYRVDPGSNFASMAMVDDGSSGDLIAGDGVYSATLPGQTSGTLVAFHLAASDQFVPSATTTFPSDAPRRECLVRFGETLPAGDFGTYRIWITQATSKKWASRPKLSNDPLDATFVYGDQRIVYNVGALYSGSPYHSPGYTTPTGAPCDYTFIFAADDSFLGETDVHLSWPGNGGDDSTGQREQAAYWIAGQIGLPFNYRRFMILYVNGVRRNSIMEDTQRANSVIVDQWFPDATKGDLFKIAGWFEFNDPGSDFNNDTIWATLQNFTTLDLATNQRVKKVGRYRWNWQKRVIQNSASDYTSLFALVDAVNTPGADAYTTRVEAIVDVDQWMRTFAVEHVVGNWDSYGDNNGQNMYAYKPADGPWRLLIWDLDIALGGISDAATSSLFQVADATIGRMYNHPPFRRSYFRALQELVNGPLLSSNANPVLDAKYAALLASGISVTLPSGIKSYISQRRTSVVSQLSRLNPPFSITINGGSDFSTNQNLATLTGVAPIGVKTIKVNGIPYHPTWTSITNWVLRLPLADGNNHLTIQGFDTQGVLLTNATAAINVTFTGSDDFPFDHLVINEIMYHPGVPDAEFVEIHNTSATTAFDLTNYRLDGADFTFGDGTIIPAGGFVVVARNRTVFAATYGASIPVAGEFDGKLNNAGETLRLIKPGQSPADDLVIDVVRFNNNLPWPVAADGTGPSLQLIDPTQDNTRVANWAAVNTNSVPGLAPYTPGATNSVLAALPVFPPLWLNEIQPDNITGIRDRAGDRHPWLELFNGGANAMDLSEYFLTDNFTNLTRWMFPGDASINPSQFAVVWLDGEPGESSTNEWHANFRIAPSTGSIALVKNLNGQAAVMDYFSFNSVEPDRSLGSFPDGNSSSRQIFYYATPNATNNNAPGPLTLFINEWMASNTRTLTNPVGGQFDDWLEIYNPNPQAIALSGFTLTDDLTNTAKFVIPAGRTIAAGGHLLVWADKQSNQNSAGALDLHANFKLDKDGDELGLFAPDGRRIDAVKFSNQTDDLSQGRWPDGSPAPYFSFASPTPRTANFVPPDTPYEIRLMETTLSPGNFVTLTWTAQTDRIYRLQYKERLSDASWADVSGDVFAYSNTASKTDTTAGGGDQRFYRVVVMP